jgi:hypothetical protein
MARLVSRLKKSGRVQAAADTRSRANAAQRKGRLSSIIAKPIPARLFFDEKMRGNLCCIASAQSSGTG